MIVMLAVVLGLAAFCGTARRPSATADAGADDHRLLAAVDRALHGKDVAGGGQVAEQPGAWAIAAFALGHVHPAVLARDGGRRGKRRGLDGESESKGQHGEAPIHGRVTMEAGAATAPPIAAATG